MGRENYWPTTIAGAVAIGLLFQAGVEVGREHYDHFWGYVGIGGVAALLALVAYPPVYHTIMTSLEHDGTPSDEV